MTLHRKLDLTAGTGVGTASINAGGSYAPDGTGLAASQASTSGAGLGATFLVTITAGVLASIDAIVIRGSGYAPADTITLAIAGEIAAAVIDVDTIGGLADDEDWAQDHTLPTFGKDLAAGNATELEAPRGKISITFELRDGMADGATPVAAPDGAVVTSRTVTHRGADGGIYRQSPQRVSAMQTTYIDDELVTNQASWVRVHSAENLPATGAMWIDVTSEVGP